MEKAVEHAPHMIQYSDRLAAYRALAGQLPELVETPASGAAVNSAAVSPKETSGQRGWPQWLASLEWNSLSDRLTREGCVMLPALVNASTCAELGNMFDDESLFAKTVVMFRPS